MRRAITNPHITPSLAGNLTNTRANQIWLVSTGPNATKTNAYFEARTVSERHKSKQISRGSKIECHTQEKSASPPGNRHRNPRSSKTKLVWKGRTKENVSCMTPAAHSHQRIHTEKRQNELRPRGKKWTHG